MYYLTVEEKISSAHQLRGYKGRCENLHGHNWRILLTVKGSRLDECGMLIDFHELKPMLKEVLSPIDHTLINDHPFFNEHNPSSENLARFIFEGVALLLDRGQHREVHVESVTVYESDTSWCVYRLN